MSSGIPSFPAAPGDDDELTTQLAALVSAIHGTWGAQRERRRMRAFGFIPANEEGVLKRDWHGLRVRVDPDLLRVIAPGEGELTHRTSDGTMLLDGQPYRPGRLGLRIAEGLVDLIRSYERWIEAREGREGRLSRSAPSDRRPFNALAETRRVQRLLGQATRGRARGR